MYHRTRPNGSIALLIASKFPCQRLSYRRIPYAELQASRSWKTRSLNRDSAFARWRSHQNITSAILQPRCSSRIKLCSALLQLTLDGRKRRAHTLAPRYGVPFRAQCTQSPLIGWPGRSRSTPRNRCWTPCPPPKSTPRPGNPGEAENSSARHFPLLTLDF